MEDQFGSSYAASLAQDHVLYGLGGVTVSQALDRGDDPKWVWQSGMRRVRGAGEPAVTTTGVSCAASNECSDNVKSVMGCPQVGRDHSKLSHRVPSVSHDRVHSSGSDFQE